MGRWPAMAPLMAINGGRHNGEEMGGERGRNDCPFLVTGGRRARRFGRGPRGLVLRRCCWGGCLGSCRRGARGRAVSGLRAWRGRVRRLLGRGVFGRARGSRAGARPAGGGRQAVGSWLGPRSVLARDGQVRSGGAVDCAAEKGRGGRWLGGALVGFRVRLG
jgi:hypothetical protein